MEGDQRQRVGELIASAKRYALLSSSPPRRGRETCAQQKPRCRLGNRVKIGGNRLKIRGESLGSGLHIPMKCGELGADERRLDACQIPTPPQPREEAEAERDPAAR